MKESIQETLRKQHSKTMEVVNAIKGDTADLKKVTGDIMDRVPEGIGSTENSETGKETISPEILPASADTEKTCEELPEKPPEKLSGVSLSDNILTAAEKETLIQEITPVVVQAVVGQIEPLLQKLKQIAGESGDQSTAQGNEGNALPDDADAFAKQLIERMEQSLDRRTRVAMAKNKFSNIQNKGI